MQETVERVLKQLKELKISLKRRKAIILVGFSLIGVEVTEDPTRGGGMWSIQES